MTNRIMSHVYGAPTLMQWPVGSLEEVKRIQSRTFRLEEPDRVRVKLRFERGTDKRFKRYTPANARYQTAPDAKEYKWRLEVDDFNGLESVELEIKAWLQSSEDLRFILTDGEVETFLLNRYHAIFSKGVKNHVEEWEQLELCVEVRPLIEKPVVVEKPIVVEKLVFERDNSKLSEQLAHAFKNQTCANLTINVGDQAFKVSEFMLRARSDVFNAMFTHETEEQQTKVIEIKNAAPEIVKKMLEFMYTGKVDDLKSSAADLLRLADQYQLKDLCDQCADQMCGDLKVETIMEQLERVALYDHLTDFKMRVLKFTKENLSQVCKLPDWKEFGKNNGNILVELLPTTD